ncbi:chaperonin 10-like protein [Talaromyces proteolyticus]|uniref:Chaperonin 10-like protein n=1 Tax=Talaromyces proteolyticus TaxID=1131652 RepID=A0AAD4Q0F2_9EURO|nr:chaperonin 10-like protein [Talaromyces proteolyticus]KAH8700744.1 chaperonin 10-like protein [Talaromyces proteolyticus]
MAIQTMNAVVFRGPFNISVERKAKPQIKQQTDAIVRVKSAGICGSELHMYRGHQKTGTGHIMGHEFVGTVEQVGGKVIDFQPGDSVVAIFSPVCMKCWYCVRGLTNRCVEGTAFGTQQLDGGQAEFVRVPFADGTLQRVPPELDDRLLIMMCDIFPTGYYGASRAIEGLCNQLESPLTSKSKLLFDQTIVVLGCGPVGICAIATILSKGVRRIYAVDSVEDRLKEAEQLGATSLKLGQDDIEETIMAVTDGRGADAVVEVVGNQDALRSAFNLLRPCGILSSVGFHQSELPFTGLDCYLKNITVNFGRVPVRTVFNDALECLKQNEAKLKTYVSHELDLKDASEGFAMFAQHKARKVILRV